MTATLMYLLRRNQEDPPPPPPPPPTIVFPATSQVEQVPEPDKDVTETSAGKKEEKRRLLSKVVPKPTDTIKTSAQGDTSDAPVQRKRLLGSGTGLSKTGE